MNKIKKIGIMVTIIAMFFAIGIESLAADQTAIFLSSDFSGDQYAKDAANYVGLMYRKLGYSISTGSGADLFTIVSNRSTVMNYIGQSSNNYGVYISSHGNATPLISIQYGQSAHYIYPNQITGNWHFVFLDSCSSLVNTDFANAFKTTSAYANRGILGWFNTVDTPATAQFMPYMYVYSGTRSLRQAAVDAAGNCSLYTPIRFYGDTSWYGWSW